MKIIWYILIALSFGSQAYATTMTVDFKGTINLERLGGDSKTVLAGVFDIGSKGTLSNLQIYPGDDVIAAVNGKTLFRNDVKLGHNNDILLMGSGHDNLSGSILGNEINALWGLFGFSDNEITGQLIQSGSVSPSVLQYSRLMFGYREHPGLFGFRVLSARLDSVNITSVPLPAGFSLMLSGLMLIVSLLLVQNRETVT